MSDVTYTPMAAVAEPLTLMDLDAAGLDPRVPAPPEFIQFVYDNSRSGYLTLWSALLDQPDGPSIIQKWLSDALTVYHSRSLLTQMAPPGDKPVGSNVTEVTYSGPVGPPAPVCVDVPLVTGTAALGAVLNCTMGNWGNEPTDYAYAWSSGGTGPNYTVVEGDAGTSLTCIVSATNAGGTTAAPPSNAIAIPAGAGTQARSSAREYPKAEAKEETKEEAKPEVRAGHTTGSAERDNRRR